MVDPKEPELEEAADADDDTIPDVRSDDPETYQDKPREDDPNASEVDTPLEDGS